MLIDEFMDKVIKLRLSSLDLVDKTLYLYLLLRSQLNQTQLSDGRTPASNISKIILEKKKKKRMKSLINLHRRDSPASPYMESPSNCRGY